ncbi:hypothetical protein V6N11_077317 [Hibiscus sabdariffa]|uniref:Uncharacterized protein n=1 Tax=Hibiscus sabdariffa TaxID=183260 RepID=A0ABR2TD52_9ROSI
MAGNGIGVTVNDKQRRGRSNENEPDVSYFPGRAGSRNIAPLDSRIKNPHDLRVCPLCLNKMEDPISCMNTLLLCPHCNDILLVSENSRGKFLSPISSDIPGPKHVPPVCTPRQQYDLVLEDPRYFHIMRELVSTIKSKPFPYAFTSSFALCCCVTVLLVSNQSFFSLCKLQSSCNIQRKGIERASDVTLERRLQVVSTALAENLSDKDLYKIYMIVLYDLETCLCHFPPAPPLRPYSSSQWIQASTPYTNATPVNNNQQWTSLPPSFNNGYTNHSNRSSSGPCPMPGVTLKGGQPSSSNMNPAVTYNNQMWITETSGPDYFSNLESAGHCSSSHPTPCSTGSSQGFIGQPSGWIQTSAPYTNSVSVKNNQQLASFRQTAVNFGSTYHPNGTSSDLSSVIENDNQVSDFKFNLGLDSKNHTSSSLPVPHPTHGLTGGQASEQGIHDPSHNQRMMVKRKVLTKSFEPVKKTRMLSSLPKR